LYGGMAEVYILIFCWGRDGNTDRADVDWGLSRGAPVFFQDLLPLAHVSNRIEAWTGVAIASVTRLCTG
jgi:hypothetical protein